MLCKNCTIWFEKAGTYKNDNGLSLTDSEKSISIDPFIYELMPQYS